MNLVNPLRLMEKGVILDSLLMVRHLHIFISELTQLNLTLLPSSNLSVSTNVMTSSQEYVFYSLD